MTRRYTEAEVRMILDRAVEVGDVAAPSSRDGMSLEEIKEIGAEVGIEGTSIERAAQSLQARATGPRSSWSGGAVSLHSELQVAGDLGSVSTNAILSLIRREMGRQGDLSEVGGLLEWRSTGELSEEAITLSSEHESTTITGSADLRNAAVVTFLPGSILGGFGSILWFIQAANAGNEIGMVLAALVLPVLLLAMRLVFRRISRGEAEKLERVLEGLGGLLEEAHEE